MRVVLVSSILPDTNYSAYLADAVLKIIKEYNRQIDFLVYGENEGGFCNKYFYRVWDKNIGMMELIRLIDI